MRTLRRLGIPTLLFVNKIDRGGAQEGRVLEAIVDKLTPAIAPMGWTTQVGTKQGQLGGGVNASSAICCVDSQ